MKILKKISPQGDVMVRRISQLPAGVVPVTNPTGQVSASETGHIHRVVRKRQDTELEWFEDPNNQRRIYARVKQTAEAAKEQANAMLSNIEDVLKENSALQLVHEKTGGHEAYALPCPEEEAFFVFNRQRELTVQGFERQISD